MIHPVVAKVGGLQGQGAKNEKACWVGTHVERMAGRNRQILPAAAMT